MYLPERYERIIRGSVDFLFDNFRHLGKMFSKGGTRFCRTWNKSTNTGGIFFKFKILSIDLKVMTCMYVQENTMTRIKPA